MATALFAAVAWVSSAPVSIPIAAVSIIASAGAYWMSGNTAPSPQPRGPPIKLAAPRKTQVKAKTLLGEIASFDQKRLKPTVTLPYVPPPDPLAQLLANRISTREEPPSLASSWSR